MKNFSRLQEKIGTCFKNQELLKQALVHRSYLNENPGFNLNHNERLEYLGDAVLELIVSEYLYRHYPNPEGDLTNWRASLVNARMLSELAVELDLDDYLFLSRGEAKDKNSKARQSILADAFEAVIGAIYLDQGFKVAKEMIEKKLLARLPEIIKNQLYLDPKSKFQEIAQERSSITPTYKVLEESGPDHNKHFKVGVYLGKDFVAYGEGTSKQEAQLDAAQNALQEKDW
jgi:ribonuclease-3